MRKVRRMMETIEEYWSMFEAFMKVLAKDTKCYEKRGPTMAKVVDKCIGGCEDLEMFEVTLSLMILKININELKNSSINQ